MTMWCRFLFVSGCAASVAAGCADNGRATHPDASSLFTCTSSAECDDHTACTIDNCDVSGVCQHMGIDAMCPTGQHCVSGTGCTATMSCMDSSMCDDGLACTIDTCNVGNVCGHQAVDSLCSPPTPVCDATLGCIAGTTPQCTSTAQCDDSLACTIDSCGVDMMCHHMTVDTLCGSGERCDATMGCVMTHACTSAADCMDPSFWNFCDGTPNCSPEFGCMFPAPHVCDDGNPCTLDSCDRTAGANGACVTACDHSMSACASDPACATTTLPCQTGVFLITPMISNHCAMDLSGAYQVNYDISQFTFNVGGGMLNAQPGTTSASFGSLNDPAPACPSFHATATVSGGVTESYTLDGTFTDADHFTGTWIQHYTGFGHSVCPEASIAVSGTRM